MTIDVNIKQLSDGGGIEARNHARWYESCCLKFNQLSVKNKVIVLLHLCQYPSICLCYRAIDLKLKSSAFCVMIQVDLKVYIKLGMFSSFE